MNPESNKFAWNGLRAAAVLAFLLLAVPANASAPPGVGLPQWIGLCEGGSEAGNSCSKHTDCLGGGKCRAQLLKGRGTRINATLTAIVDDDVTDMVGNSSRFDAEETSRAVTILLEFKYGGQFYALSETYQSRTEPWKAPNVTGFTSLQESFLDVNPPAGLADIEEVCANRSYEETQGGTPWSLGGAHPLGTTIAKQLRRILGYNENDPGVPVIMSAKARGKPNPVYETGPGAELASMIRCRVKISFADFPLPEPALTFSGQYGPCPGLQDAECTTANNGVTPAENRVCLNTEYFDGRGATDVTFCTGPCELDSDCGLLKCIPDAASTEVGFCRRECTTDSECAGFNQICTEGHCWWPEP